MDDKDFEIYMMLQKDGRVKLVDIAKRVGLTHPSVKERIKKLLDNQEVSITALYNIKDKGFKTAVVNLEVESMNIAVRMANKFSKCPRTLFVVPSTGKYNLNLIFIAESNYILEEIIENTLRPQTEVKKIDVSIGEAPFYPEFVNLKISRNMEKAPCGKVCTSCSLYKSKCSGCPATQFFNLQYEK